MSKKDNLICHTKQRLRERYGLRYTSSLRHRLIRAKNNPTAKFISKESNRVTIFDIFYNVVENDICNSNLAKPGLTKIRIVFDKFRKTIITVLPLENT